MPYYICITCGTQHAASDQPPPRCAICEDERQFVNWGGQQWTTLERLRERHGIVLRREDPGLDGVGIEPPFAIGQRALLVRATSGNVLWDCIPLIDGAIADAVQGLGGIRAIAISHPHYYSAMVEWSEACDGAPIYLHAADRAWVMRPHPAIRFWEGERHDLGPGLTLIRCGGHFAGGTVLHWAGGASGQGALLATFWQAWSRSLTSTSTAPGGTARSWPVGATRCCARASAISRRSPPARRLRSQRAVQPPHQRQQPREVGLGGEHH